MAPSKVCRAAVGVALSSVAVFLAGCGGGGADPTPAPTPAPAPTAPPTPAPTTAVPTLAPTLPPTDAGQDGICAVKDPNAAVSTINVYEAKCNDEKKQLDTLTVTMVTQTLPFGGLETCQIAVDSYMRSKCPEGGDGVSEIEKNETYGHCVIKTVNDVGVEISELVWKRCDAAKEQSTNEEHTRVPSTVPYGQEQECQPQLVRWKEGYETANPGACVKPASSEELRMAIQAVQAIKTVTEEQNIQQIV